MVQKPVFFTVFFQQIYIDCNVQSDFIFPRHVFDQNTLLSIDKSMIMFTCLSILFMSGIVLLVGNTDARPTYNMNVSMIISICLIMF